MIVVYYILKFINISTLINKIYFINSCIKKLELKKKYKEKDFGCIFKLFFEKYSSNA